MNILIKLMSIVSLVIAPTLAAMNGNAASHDNKAQQVIKEVSIVKGDSATTMTLTATADAMPAEKLVDALVADKLIEKDNFLLTLVKGILTLDGKAQTPEITAKYKALIDSLGGAKLDIRNIKK